MTDSITCPKCETEIPLSDAISHQVEERLRAEFETEKEALVIEQAQALADKEAEAEAALAKVREEAAAAAEARAAEKVSTELSDLQAQVADQTQRREEAEGRELELMKAKRDLETERESLQLQVQRQLEEERAAIVASTKAQADEVWQHKLRESELINEQMKKRIEDLQAAADQKRSGLQGEVLEREIEDVLKESFPTDAIEPVKSGKRGADVVQRVRSNRGECGKLLWESKNHKRWSDTWVEKLLTDQQEEGADVAIIVSSVLPDAVDHAGVIDGVWVCDFASVPLLAKALRMQLDAVQRGRLVETNRSRVADDVYEYVCGREFQHFIASTVGSAVKQMEELTSDQAAATKQFARRRKQIELQLGNLAGLHGALQAVAAGALQPVAAFEFPAADEEPPEPLALAG